MIIDGKEIAEDILNALEKGRPSADSALRLGILLSAGDAATESFIKIKSRVAARLGVEVSRIELGQDADSAEAAYAVEELVKNTDGVILQMPLPAGVELAKVLEALPESHDVDALRDGARLVRPPVAEAVSEILARTGVSVAGKKAVVVGAGKLVGAPAAALLRDLGAEVEMATRNEGSLVALQSADIVVLGAGEPGLVAPGMLKEGVVLLDAGTSEAGGRLVGDADPACAQVASVFTPVPGGVGPVAVAMIFKNLFVLARAKKNPGH